MPFTAAQRTDAYRFFAIAFGAAPGVTHLRDIELAYEVGAELAQRGIGFAELRQGIVAANANFSGGKIEMGKRDYRLRAPGRFETPEAAAAEELRRREEEAVAEAEALRREIEALPAQLPAGTRAVVLEMHWARGANPLLHRARASAIGDGASVIRHCAPVVLGKGITSRILAMPVA